MKYHFSSLVIASTNIGKVQEFKLLLKDFPLRILPLSNVLNVQENGDTFIKNARIKAIAAAKITGNYSLGDDSGLCVDALSGLPGVFSARYANSDKDRIHKLLNELSGKENRKATFKAAICIVSPEKNILIEVQGECKGLITESPRGKMGFGYDSIFQVDDTGKTFGEMSHSEKEIYSHRGKGFRLLEPLLRKQLENFPPSN